MMHASFCCAFERAVVMTCFYRSVLGGVQKIVSRAQLFFNKRKEEKCIFFSVWPLFDTVDMKYTLVRVKLSLFTLEKML